VPPIHIIVKNGNVTLEGLVANAETRTSRIFKRMACQAFLGEKQSTCGEVMKQATASQKFHTA
jgi:hypothetical protein